MKNSGWSFLSDDIDDQQALVPLTWVAARPMPGACVHGFEHIVDQPLDLVIDLRHRLGQVAQAGVGKVQNIRAWPCASSQTRHSVKVMLSVAIIMEFKGHFHTL
jgi:hypothetical protein